ncbi:MAG: PDZ domain-containing protein [Ferruginibacter sp.]
MKKIIFAAMPWIFAAMGYKVSAQDTPKEDNKKEVQEIIIRKNGEKDTKLTLEFKNDKVIINGKPLIEFKDDQISVNNKKIIVRDGKSLRVFGDGDDSFSMTFDGFDDKIAHGFAFGSGAFLGVTTDKDDAGAKISDVTKESAADKAGLKQGDIITKVGDTKIENPGDLSEAINTKKPKDEVKITYKREGKEKTTKATLGERKETFNRTFSFTSPDGKMKSFSVPDVRVDGRAFTPRGDAQAFNFDNNEVVVRGFGRPKLGLKIQDLEEGDGVKVLEVEEGSAAEKAGLKKDDVIVAVGDAKVNNTDEARVQLSENAEKSNYRIEAKRNGSPMKFDIKIPKKLKTADL